MCGGRAVRNSFSAAMISVGGDICQFTSRGTLQVRAAELAPRHRRLVQIQGSRPPWRGRYVWGNHLALEPIAVRLALLFTSIRSPWAAAARAIPDSNLTASLAILSTFEERRFQRTGG